MTEHYRVVLTSAAQKDLKSHRHALAAVLEALAILELDPESGHLLTGNMEGLRSLDFRVKGSGEYRAAYEADEGKQICLVIAIGPREGFYDRLRRRLDG